jgi:ankyrin repeat protein
MTKLQIKFYILSAVLVWLSSCSHSVETKEMASASPCMRYLFAQDLESIKANSSECVHYRTEEGLTLLMMAASKGYTDIAQYLIEKGANVNSVNSIKQNALHFAVVHQKPEMVKLLVDNETEIKPNNFGITSLMMAVQLGTFEMVEMLDPSFEEVNIQADDGWTAVYFAVRKQDEKILDYLIEKGACINVRDDYKQTPVDFANEVGWKKGHEKLKKGKVCSL